VNAAEEYTSIIIDYWQESEKRKRWPLIDDVSSWRRDEDDVIEQVTMFKNIFEFYLIRGKSCDFSELTGMVSRLTEQIKRSNLECNSVKGCATRKFKHN